MPQPLVQVCHLQRRFGSVQAVDDLSFEIHPGQVVGFIGANGSGKTTTMRMMATLETPDGGSISVAGFDTQNFPNKVRQLVGWMPDAYGTYAHTTVREYLDFYARAFGFRGAERRQRVDEVMEFASLADLAERPMDKLSKGMAQRLCLGRTLLHDPPLLLLDEPAAGLDPKARIDFKRLVRLLAEEGKTLFISSHILTELGEMCDTLLFIDGGRLVHHGSAESLKRSNTAREAVVEIVLAQAPGTHPPLAEWAELQPGVRLLETTRNGARLILAESGGDTNADPRAALAALLRRLLRDGFPVAEFYTQERRLEDVFVDLLQNPHAPEPLKTSASAAEPPPLPGYANAAETDANAPY